MKRMLIMGGNAFLMTTMRVARRYATVTVVGVRDDDPPLTRTLRDAAPDLVLLDGSEAVESTLRRLANVNDACPDAVVVALGTRMDGEALERLLEAGATVCLSRALTATHLEALLAQAGPSDADAGHPVRARETTPCPLTNRELEIARRVAEGHTSARIGRDLWVTEQTVKFHLGNIYRKLGVSNRTEASRYMLLNDSWGPVAAPTPPAAVTDGPRRPMPAAWSRPRARAS